jgi:hypothetical protein
MEYYVVCKVFRLDMYRPIGLRICGISPHQPPHYQFIFYVYDTGSMSCRPCLPLGQWCADNNRTVMGSDIAGLDTFDF